MSEEMNLSVNGQSQVPPGFRFHPTEEELLHYYLRKKVAYEKIDLDVIRDVDLNKLEPWDIQEKCKIGSTPQNDWYFFSHKDKKYPTGTRTNRATAAGFWKATGRDKVIYSSFRRIGMRKTLVFYKGRAPHGLKSDWIMHEYRLDDNPPHDSTAPCVNTAAAAAGGGDSTVAEDGWVVCRVFKKKNYHKTSESPQRSSTSMDSSRFLNTQERGGVGIGVLDQILQYMGKSYCKEESELNTNFNYNNDPNANLPLKQTSGIGFGSSDDGLYPRFIHLPRLENPTTTTTIAALLDNSKDNNFHVDDASKVKVVLEGDLQDGLHDWEAFDRLVASQLNGGGGVAVLSSGDHPCNDDLCFSIDHDTVVQQHSASNLVQQLRSNKFNHSQQIHNSEIDLWSFPRSSSSSSSNPLCHLSV